MSTFDNRAEIDASLWKIEFHQGTTLPFTTQGARTLKVWNRRIAFWITLSLFPY